ncbi:ROK family transcriptional regulator [Natronospora cellulosivora (SeqCode)]
MRRASFELMKKINEKLILKLIYKNKLISRAEIAEETGLSPATVSNITKELLELKLVKESSRGKSRGGRKPVLLELNAKGAYFIGLEWGILNLKAVLMDLNKNIIAYEKITINNYSLENFIQLSRDMIKNMESKIEKKQIYGIGIGLHGLVNPDKGVSLFAPHFQWKELEVKKELVKHFDYPIFIDNDVRVMALAEKWNEHQNFIFVNTGSGIGAAIVIDDKLFKGYDFSAGEFGHMSIVENGPLCSCGNHGCLESLISTKRLLRKYNKDFNPDLSLKDMKSQWDDLLNDFSMGKNKAVDLLEEAANYLGIGLANLVNLLNPKEIIIGGDLAGNQRLLEIINKKVKEKSLHIAGKNITITFTSFGEKVGAIGAATMVLEEIFQVEE